MSSGLFSNIQHFSSGSKINSIIEFPLYTDVTNITGEINSSPYKFPFAFLNALVDYKKNILLPRIVLRYFDYGDVGEYYSNQIDLSSQESKSNLKNSITLDPHEELACILSLILGIRIKVGSGNRSFDAKSLSLNNYFGSILNMGAFLNPMPIPLTLQNPIIPYAIRIYSDKTFVSLNEAEKYLSHITKIQNIMEYNSFIRSAKFYNDALWLSESDPQISWILFVSAIESAAGDKTKGQRALLREYHPDIVKEVQDNVILNNYKEPTAENDIPEIFKADLENLSKLKIILKTIYDFRSRALHSGQPFPEEMCESPIRIYDQKIILSERPLKTISSKRKSVIYPEDKPLHLWKFEEIVRLSLLN
jgi:hypothetical protein